MKPQLINLRQAIPALTEFLEPKGFEIIFDCQLIVINKGRKYNVRQAAKTILDFVANRFSYTGKLIANFTDHEIKITFQR